MVATRTARQLSGFNYEKIINAIDWNRVLLEAEGRHLMWHPGAGGRDICGECLRVVLLQREEF